MRHAPGAWMVPSRLAVGRRHGAARRQHKSDRESRRGAKAETHDKGFARASQRRACIYVRFANRNSQCGIAPGRCLKPGTSRSEHPWNWDRWGQDISAEPVESRRSSASSDANLTDFADGLRAEGRKVEASGMGFWKHGRHARSRFSGEGPTHSDASPDSAERTGLG